jgi:ABC-2 type transport system ATP-binding protein
VRAGRTGCHFPICTKPCPKQQQHIFKLHHPLHRFLLTFVPMSITVNNLRKQYGAQTAVNAVSFSLNPGSITGFLGPNGAGKSTTMKMITGYLQPDGGDAVVCGISVAENALAARERIGYLPEANPLYTDMYIREYLDFVAGIHGVKNKKQRIEEVIALVGLTPESSKKIGQLSKGYKQRVGIAAALIHDPEVVILDEPTSGLDPNQIIEIREVIRKLGQHKTVLFSSHILQEVAALCDRVIIISKGRIVADDSLQNLQKGSSRNIVKVVFKEPADAALLKNLNGADDVTASDAGWEIATTDDASIRKQLLELALRHNLNIISLTSDNQSLEEVFRKLTN